MLFEKFSEADVEEAFVEYMLSKPWIKLIGRQVKLPYGIADVMLIADCDDSVTPYASMPFVAEIKKGEIDLSACGQLLGYLSQSRVVIREYFKKHFREMPIPEVQGILVGSKIEQRAKRVITDIDIRFYKFDFNNHQFNFTSDFSGLLCRNYNYDQRIKDGLVMMAEKQKVSKLKELMGL